MLLRILTDLIDNIVYFLNYFKRPVPGLFITVFGAIVNTLNVDRIAFTDILLFWRLGGDIMTDRTISQQVDVLVTVPASLISENIFFVLFLCLNYSI